MDSHGLTEQLHFLIKCLETEMPEYAGYALPVDPKQAFDLYRALCNVRMPSGDTGHTLPDDFYTVQSEALQNITEKKGSQMQRLCRRAGWISVFFSGREISQRYRSMRL